MMNLMEREKKFIQMGKIYEGNFIKGEYNGEGTWYYFNGDKLEGVWMNGCRNGKFKKTLKNGEEYIVEYKNDLKINEEKILK